jgi:hypothetical protein
MTLALVGGQGGGSHGVLHGPWLWIAVVFVLVLMLLMRFGVPWGRGDSRPPRRDEPLSPANPGNMSPLMRAWRRRRAAAGKGDNWLTRPIITIGQSQQRPPEDKRRD